MEFSALVPDFLNSTSSGTKKCKFMLMKASRNSINRYLKRHSELEELYEVVSNRKDNDKKNEKLATECGLQNSFYINNFFIYVTFVICFKVVNLSIVIATTP